jgi:serine/threonine protein kinase
MSPEQVQGMSVDHRSDIFSFGCILYEAATRRKPFNAETGIETMHKILNEKPAPIEELNDKVPAELRRLVKRCLAKSPDQRAQSIKDVAIELREIVEEYDTLSASASSSKHASGAAASLALA